MSLGLAKIELVSLLLTCLLRNLYAGQEATVRTGHGTTDWFQIRKGVHQGCILSPCLFNLYADYIMRNPGLEEVQAGIKIAGRNINNLRLSYRGSPKPPGHGGRTSAKKKKKKKKDPFQNILLIDEALDQLRLLMKMHNEINVIMPANTVSILQPMDQGVTSTFKSYSLNIFHKAVVAIDSDSFSGSAQSKLETFWKGVDVLRFH